MIDVNAIKEPPRKCNLHDMLKRVVKTEYVVLPDMKTTVCILYIENGFTVRGESACVDPGEFNKALGEKYSYERAVNELWPLEGYLLAEKRWEFYKNHKIPSTVENWENRVLGADPAFVRRASPEMEAEVTKAIKKNV